MQDIILSPHFALSEFTESATARKYGIANEPPAEAVENLRSLSIHTLEPLREALGLPIVITSGYRCKSLNERIAHHSQRSQHMQGQAADLVVQGSGAAGSRFKVQGSVAAEFKVQGSGAASSRFKVQGGSPRELLVEAFRTIITDPKINFDQVIIYPSFIHVSFVSNGKNRRKITRGFGNGKYCALSRAEALELC